MERRGKTAGSGPEFVVIVGCGRLGALLAGSLSKGGSNVVVIDRREAAFAELPADFSGFRLTGDAVELEVLRAARLEQADCLLATTEQDNVNLMVTQVARTVFAVPRVLARVYDPQKETVYREFGVEIISPTRMLADRFLATLADRGGASCG